MLSDAQLLRLERLFFDAALEPERWPLALEAMAEATGSARGQLIGIGGPAVTPFNWITGPVDDFAEAFAAIDGHAPDVNFRVAAGLESADLEVVGEDRYDVVRKRLRTDDYAALCAEYDIPYGIQTNLQSEPECLIGLACLRSAADGRSDADQREAFGQIARIAANAVRTQAALEIRGTELVAGTLEAMNSAAILIDGNGYARAVTPAAEEIIGCGYGLRMDGNRISAEHPKSREEFGQALTEALSDDMPGRRVRSLIVQTSLPEAPPIMVRLTSLPRREWSLPFRPRLIISLRRPDPPPLETSLLQEAFDLTPKEAEVASSLGVGRSRGEIAERHGVSPSTVITQLKSIFDKMQVSREAAAIALIRDMLG